MAKGGNKPNSTKGKAAKSSSARDGRTSEKTTERDIDPYPTKIARGLQQHCLNIFRDALRPSQNDVEILQEVKRHLFNRDFDAAFGKDDYLRVYASRWSPSRALGYLKILDGLTSDLVSNHSDTTVFDVVCIGGGAGGELVALAAWTNTLRQSGILHKVHVTLVDIADWSLVVSALGSGITKPPELSKYASQAQKDANNALLAAYDITISFHQADVLDSSQTSISNLLSQADLVTFMFTLNELYSASMAKTQNLLSVTLDVMRNGANLLVIDSPGSYSTISINGAEKNYPMQWLFNYTLLGDPREPKDQRTAKWEQKISNDSRWFRMPEGLHYPIDLENMRYQIHLYRRASDSGGQNNNQGGLK